MSKDNASNNNKPNFLTKWWFWAIVVAVIAGAAVTVSRNGNGNQPVSTQGATVVGTNTSPTSEPEETKEYNLGDVISIAGSKVAVTAVERNYSTGNQYSVPKDGKEFVKVTVSIENVDNDSLAYNVYYWKIEDANGAVTTAAGQTYSLDDALNSGELTKGGKVSGSIVYEIPAGDSAKMHYQYSPMYSDKQVVIKI